LLAEGEDARYERAALRWHARFTYETKNIDIRESVAVLALLTAIPANRLAASALADLFSQAAEPRAMRRGTCPQPRHLSVGREGRRTSELTRNGLRAVRAVAFICTAIVTALILHAALFIALAVNDKSDFAPTECEFDTVECGAAMEFVYDDTWPLVGLLLLLPGIPIGWFLARRIR
jgi:hypothetical protein